MSNRRKSNAVILILLLLAAWNPDLPAIDWLGPIGPRGPVSRVVVLYESSVSGIEGARIAAVTGGVTSQALRKADKWRLWDKDSVPAEGKALIDGAKQLPWVAVLHGAKVTHAGPLPATEAEFSALIAKQGGI